MKIKNFLFSNKLLQKLTHCRTKLDIKEEFIKRKNTMIKNILKNITECRHEKVTDGKSYCPDCGKLVEVKWYITRCSCCKIKRRAYTDFWGEIKPEGMFCPNCGTKEFFIEECEKINFVDINFAVQKKEEVQVEKYPGNTQIWEDTGFSSQILIGRAI